MAWTITETVKHKKMISQAGDELIIVKLACISDANACDYPITSDIAGSWLYLVKIVPSAAPNAPTGVFDLDIEDDTDAHILDTDGNSVSATAWHIGSSTVGVFPPIFDTCSVVCATLGDTKRADIYLYFTR
jgi:hypothetical protein